MATSGIYSCKGLTLYRNVADGDITSFDSIVVSDVEYEYNGNYGPDNIASWNFTNIISYGTIFNLVAYESSSNPPFLEIPVDENNNYYIRLVNDYNPYLIETLKANGITFNTNFGSSAGLWWKYDSDISRNITPLIIARVVYEDIPYIFILNPNLNTNRISRKLTLLSGIFGNHYIEKIPTMVNFYRSSPEGDIAVNRGETVNLEFTAVYDDGSTVTPYTDIVYSDLPPESVATFSGNSFTISENCRASIFTSIARPNIKDTTLYAFVQAKISNPVNPYLPDGGGISGGGAQSGSSNVIGSFDGTGGPSVANGIPDGSVGSDIASSGMYTKYLCDGGVLNVIAQYLWEDNVGIQALKAIIGNPIDSIISLISYPFALDTLVPTTETKIYFGKYNSLLSANAITKSSLQIDWGTVEIPFFWGGFLDYSPYTQIQLYLPWGVGFVSIDPNEVMPWSSTNSYKQGSFTKGSVSVVTNIELDKGSCLHNVIGNNGRVIGSFGGICGKQVPVVGTNDAARTLALIGAAVSAGTTLGMSATGQPALGKGLAYGKNMSQMNRAEGREMLSDYNSAVSGMLASTRAAAKSPPTYPRAGTFSDATSLLSVQYPYLIISRPSQSIPKQYGRFMGYPSNIFHNHLGEVRGYTEVSSIHLDDIPATSTELNELESILKGGVLL